MSKQSIFDFSNIKGDIFGGLTAGVVALPLALAFGVQSGMGAIAGLYGAIAIGIFAALFGGTPTQVSGPTAPMTVVTALVVGTAVEKFGSVDQGMWMIIAIFFLAGLFQVLFGIIKIGKYIKYIPYPVVSGFMTGIGVIIIIGQIYPFLGHSGAPSKILELIPTLGDPLSNIRWEAVGLASGTIAIIYLFPRITKVVPATLVALVVGTLVAVFAGLDVKTIGDIPTGLPDFKFATLLGFDFSNLSMVIIPAVTLASLGAIDSLLTSVVADNMTKTRHNSNRELIGQGIGNMVASLIGGIPGAGATVRTVVNVKAGGKTRISGIVHGIILMIVLFGAGSLAAKIPMSVLAGILITVGIGIIDYKGLKHITRVPRADAAVVIVVLLLTVFVDLLQAVGVGMVLSSLLFMKKVSDTSEAKSSLTKVDLEENWPDEKAVAKRFAGKIFIKHLYGPLTFGFVSGFKDIAQGLPKEVELVVLRMDRVPFIDQSGLYALEDFAMGLQERGTELLIVGLDGQPLTMMRSIRLIPDLVPEKMVVEDMGGAIKVGAEILEVDVPE